MKDSPGSRVDIEDLGIHEEIWLQPPRRRQDEYYMPQAPFVFNPNEREDFVSIVSKIQTPSGYVGSIHKRLEDGKLHYMKTHDYHVLMQHVSGHPTFNLNCMIQSPNPLIDLPEHNVWLIVPQPHFLQCFHMTSSEL